MSRDRRFNSLVSTIFLRKNSTVLAGTRLVLIVRTQRAFDTAADVFLARRFRRHRFARDHFSHLGKREQDRCGGRKLHGADTHKVPDEADQTGAFRNAIAESRDHPLFEGSVGFFLRQCFVENSVHSFSFLKSLPALRALHQVSVEFVAFDGREFVMEIGREQFVELFVNRTHKHYPIEASAGLSRFRMRPRARPRIPRSAPFVRPRVCSIVP